LHIKPLLYAMMTRIFYKAQLLIVNIKDISFFKQPISLLCFIAFDYE